MRPGIAGPGNGAIGPASRDNTADPMVLEKIYYGAYVSSSENQVAVLCGSRVNSYHQCKVAHTF